jgi:hypothetical protein
VTYGSLSCVLLTVFVAFLETCTSLIGSPIFLRHLDGKSVVLDFAADHSMSRAAQKPGKTACFRGFRVASGLDALSSRATSSTKKTRNARDFGVDCRTNNL